MKKKMENLKKPEVKKEELLKTEKKETSGQDKVLKEENHEIISITDIGLSSTDPRYQKKSIETKKTPPPQKGERKKNKVQCRRNPGKDLKRSLYHSKGSSGKFQRYDGSVPEKTLPGNRKGKKTY